MHRRTGLLFICFIYSFAIIYGEDSGSPSNDDEAKIRELLQRNGRLRALERYDGPKTCTYPHIADAISIPVLYINLDSAKDRRAAIERAFGCLDLYRLPAVRGSNDDEVVPMLAHAVSDSPGLIDRIGDEAKREDETRKRKDGSGYRRPQESSTLARRIFRNTLGCLMSHVKAAYALALSKAPAALILEDDITDELLPYWTHRTIDDLLTSEDYKEIEAVQLSLQSSETVWEQLLSSVVSNKGRASFVSPSDDSTSWLASNGAYLLTRLGALRIIKTLLTNDLLMNFTALQCINIDICFMPHLGNKYIRLPPLFTHGKMSLKDDAYYRKNKMLYRAEVRKNLSLIDFTELDDYFSIKSEDFKTTTDTSLYKSTIASPSATSHSRDQLYLNRVSRTYSMLLAVTSFVERPDDRVTYGKEYSKEYYYNPLGIKPPDIRPPPNFTMTS